MLVIDIGQGGMDTLNSNLVKDNLNIYNKHYSVNLGTISMKCFENVKEMVRNKNPFDLVSDLKLIMFGIGFELQPSLLISELFVILFNKIKS